MCLSGHKKVQEGTESMHVSRVHTMKQHIDNTTMSHGNGNSCMVSGALRQSLEGIKSILETNGFRKKKNHTEKKRPAHTCLSLQKQAAFRCKINFSLNTENYEHGNVQTSVPSAKDNFSWNGK